MDEYNDKKLVPITDEEIFCKEESLRRNITDLQSKLGEARAELARLLHGDKVSELTF